MNTEALGQLFYREVAKITENKQLDKLGKVAAIHRLINALFVELTRKERLHFTTLFARITYASHQFKLEKSLQFYLHHFRRQANLKDKSQLDNDQLLGLGLKVICETIRAALGIDAPLTLNSRIPEQWPYPFSPVRITNFKSKARVLLLDQDEDRAQLLGRDEHYPEELIRIQYNIPERNENFNPSIHAIKLIFGFPLVVNLLDIEIDEEGVYRPRAFVIEPDYLVDVSAIANCFQHNASTPWGYLLKKYLPFVASPALMLGNMANFFLDELMHDADQSFRQLAPQSFFINPLGFSLFDDAVIRGIMQKGQRHFVTLQNMVKRGFEQQRILPKDCLLEPSFYSETYGLQGRLDILYRAQESEMEMAIVELKSGKPWQPNIHGISQSHYIQTLLYDLLIRSSFGHQINSANYILYSGQEHDQLRFAPPVKSQQFEALQLRNQLVGIERLLTNLGQGEIELLEQGRRLFGKLKKTQFPQWKGFMQRDLVHFETTYQLLKPLEKKYLIAFSGFIAREQRLSKMGAGVLDRSNGLAGLWLDSFEQKEENFALISDLRILENESQADEPFLIFERTPKTSPLANFRKGDIAVLYPVIEGNPRAVLANQIFKCSIIEIDRTTVRVRLRSRQFNDHDFTHFEYWNLEHDVMDAGFTSMYRGLFGFAAASADYRRLILGQRAPIEPKLASLELSPEMTAEQQRILSKIIQAEEYFLLWGPPGTGKTSIVLRHLVEYLLSETKEQLLLLAFTNRAVDEICEALDRIGGLIRDNYFRIGSSYATAPKYQSQLLQEKMKGVGSRKDLQKILKGHRIVVGTVAAVVGKDELLQLKQFDRVIIDEASQILEPLLVGLLAHFKRFVLIGDHKQLPAVVTQTAEESAVMDGELHSLGLGNLRNSLFERLFKKCQEQGWDWALDKLSHQGRMHEDIMRFPSEHFYGGNLNILPENIPVHLRQISQYPLQPNEHPLAGLLCSKRMIFLPTPIDDGSPAQKTNRHEAQMIADLVANFQELYAFNDRPFSPESIGIITPYRAQIAQIKTALQQRDLPSESITVDTVERYQGGARDIILISLCTNSSFQLLSLASLSDEGVDRKLNVALTRAREQIILLGNPDILRQNAVYAALIEFCEQN